MLRNYSILKNDSTGLASDLFLEIDKQEELIEGPQPVIHPISTQLQGCEELQKTIIRKKAKRKHSPISELES
jgi:hypothetical protein